MRKLIRTKSLLTGRENLEHLYTFKKFPIFMGCVRTPKSQDILADMVWDICKDTGIIQLRELLPLEVLYLNQHNDGTGKMWQDHYTSFAKFVRKYKPKSVLEIGGAHDHIVRNYWNLDPKTSWTIVEPNPQHITDPKIKVIRDWFDTNFKIDTKIDTVIHSHVLEHTYDPVLFLEHISKSMGDGDKHIFTFPSLLPMLKLKWTNTLNFEHTAFITEDIVDYLLKKYGFTILEKQYYGNPHSIFYATKKGKTPVSTRPIKNRYKEYKKVFMDYINFHLDTIGDLNGLIKKSRTPVYLFGAHIFSQTLIQFGLETNKVVSILDNSPMKQGKRLYGTRFTIESPKILKDKGPVNVVLKAGGYNAEIKKDILENINSEVTFW